MTRPDGQLTGAHEEYAEALTAYALGVLEQGDEHRALESHLETCAACREELAALRGTTAAIGLGLERAPLPEGLRERVLRRATEQPQGRFERPKTAARGAGRPDARGGSRWASLAWLAAAAAITVAIGSVLYARSLQQELDAARQIAAQAATRAETLRAEVIDLRLRASELGRVLNVIGAPDVRLASMTGDGAAAGALAHAYWSRSRGLVFQAVGMPRLDPTRAYQLWLVPSGGAPVSVGLLQVSADGSSSHSTPLADVPAATAVAVTIEPAGGSQTPTMPIVMVGNLS